MSHIIHGRAGWVGGWVDGGQRLESKEGKVLPPNWAPMLILRCSVVGPKKYSAQGLCGLLSKHCGTEVNCIVMENTLMNQNSQGFVFC